MQKSNSRKCADSGAHTPSSSSPWAQVQSPRVQVPSAKPNQQSRQLAETRSCSQNLQMVRLVFPPEDDITNTNH